MPKVKTDDGCIIHVEVEGPQAGPVLMLSNSLGTNWHMCAGTTYEAARGRRTLANL